MLKKKEIQTKIDDFKSHQVALDDEAYNFLSYLKEKLSKKYKRYFNFSDVIRELKRSERR